MRALRVVGVTEGGDVVLEDPARRERFTVPADEQLRAAARGDITRLGQIAIELESQLRPREIQARIRAGASVEQVASAAGVPLQKIERFAYPVLLERSRTAEIAQRAHPVRADGPDVRTLGDVVAHTFGLRGQEYADAEWDSWKGEDSKWVVALSWRAGRSDNRAHWTFTPGANGGTVTALDEHASDLVEGLPARPLRPVGPVIDIASRPDEPEPAPQSNELRATASDAVQRADWERPTRPERTQAEPESAGDRHGHGPDRPYADRPVYGERPRTTERAAMERSTLERGTVDRPASARTVVERRGSTRGTTRGDAPVPSWAAEPADAYVPIERFGPEPSAPEVDDVPAEDTAPAGNALDAALLADSGVEIEQFTVEPAADLVPAAEQDTEDLPESGPAPWSSAPGPADPGTSAAVDASAAAVLAEAAEGAVVDDEAVTAVAADSGAVAADSDQAVEIAEALAVEDPDAGIADAEADAIAADAEIADAEIADADAVLATTEPATTEPADAAEPVVELEAPVVPDAEVEAVEIEAVEIDDAGAAEPGIAAAAEVEATTDDETLDGVAEVGAPDADTAEVEVAVHPEMPAQRSAEPEPVAVAASRATPDTAAAAQAGATPTGSTQTGASPTAASPTAAAPTGAAPTGAAQAGSTQTGAAAPSAGAGAPVAAEAADAPAPAAAEPAAAEPAPEPAAAEVTPVESEPVADVPTEVAPTKATPTDAAPVADAPAEVAPAGDAPAEDASDELSPAAAEEQPAAAAKPAATQPEAPEPAEDAEEPAKPAAKPTGERTGRQQQAKPPANRRTKKGKPVMPSWDEVLLGVRGQR